MIATNDVAMTNLGYERKEGDFYETREGWITEGLCRLLREGPFFMGSDDVVWEPACGSGKMSRVLERAFKTVVSTDLYDQGYGERGKDFLIALPPEPSAQAIITNPPYSIAEEFIKKALRISKDPGGIVAMLLRNEYDCAAKRVGLFNQPPFTMKAVLTSRPWWFERQPKDSGPRHNYAWYIWMKGYDGPQTIRYISKKSARGGDV